jgi:hypothetical protein
MVCEGLIEQKNHFIKNLENYAKYLFIIVTKILLKLFNDFRDFELLKEV